jgi:hypothetical protein
MVKKSAATAELVTLPENAGGSLVSTTIAIDKDDVLMVAMAEGEALLRRKIKEELARAKNLEAIAETALKAFHAGAEANLPDYFEAYREDMEPMLARYGGAVLWTYSVRLPNAAAEKPADRKRLDVTCRADVSYKGKKTTTGLAGAFEYCQHVTLAPAVIADRTEHLDARKKMKEAEDEVLALRRKLSNMPQMERQYRAKLAAHRLKQSDQGQAVLAAMLETVHADVLALD